MAVPTAPTIDSLVTEALRKASAMDQYTRARSQWFEEIKLDIAQRKRWKVLESQLIRIPTRFTQFVSVPSDFDTAIKVSYYRGSNYGTAAGGSASTITLSSSEGITKDDAEGRFIFTTGGTGSAQKSRIVLYDPNTKVASVSPNWTTIPDSTTRYAIMDYERILGFIAYEDLKEHVGEAEVPTVYAIFNDNLYFDRVIDDKGNFSVAVEIDYYADINKIDLSSPVMSDLLREWRQPFLLGIQSKAYLEKNDARYLTIINQYELSVQRAMQRDVREGTTKRSGGLKTAGGLPIGRSL